MVHGVFYVVLRWLEFDPVGAAYQGINDGKIAGWGLTGLNKDETWLPKSSATESNAWDEGMGLTIRQSPRRRSTCRLCNSYEAI